MQRRPELLAPAGNFEKLKAAVKFGADAVYLAGESFGMRAAADNFGEDELVAAIEFAHSHSVKVYVTVNTMPHTCEYERLELHIKNLARIGADALIISDLGVFMLARRVAPKIPIHISTQASVVSAATCREWHKLGASRIVLARELTLSEITEIYQNIPPELELEAFIHGSMCVSYSGRCLLSNFYTMRDANRGACTQPCRWDYVVGDKKCDEKTEKNEDNSCRRGFFSENQPISLQISEVKRMDEKLTIVEENGESFIFGSRDLCMIEHVPSLINSGIASFKIEGRMKSAVYVATVTNAYKMAIASYFSDQSGYLFDRRLMDEVESVCHREFCTGFFFGSPLDRANVCTQNGYLKEQAALAIAVSYDKNTTRAKFIQKNKFVVGDSVSLLSPGKLPTSFVAERIFDANGEPIDSTPHPYMEFYLDLPFEVLEGDILRSHHV